MRFLPFLCWLIASPLALAQESSPSPSATVSPAPAPSAPPVSSPAPPRKFVKLQFLPPPIEGTISLGIYDGNGKLVRVLHREAKTDDFAIAADGLITKWDGCDDAGAPVPPGKYFGRGYSVAMSVALTGTAPDTAASQASSPSPAPQSKVRLRLVANPLDRDRTGAAEVTVGINAQGSFLQLGDGLPLKQVSATSNLKWATLSRGPQADSLTVTQSDGATVETYVITKDSRMMAFDCGEFEYEPDK